MNAGEEMAGHGARVPIAVTGATGYIGRVLVDALLRRGFEVRALGRRPPEPARPGVRFFRYATDDERIDPAILAGARALVHLAWDTSGRDDGGAADVRAVARLIDAASAAGVHLVFVSSQSASRDAPTAYGRGKWQAEEMVLAAGHSVVRPGLVYGREERGLFGRLCSLAATLPILPALWPEPKVQPVHVDDLCAALATIATSAPAAQRAYCVATPEPVGFNHLMRAISVHWLGRPLRSIPVPARLLLAVARAAQALGLPIQPSQLRSLFQLPPIATRDDLQRIGVDLRSLADGLRMPQRRRRRLLVREAAAMLRYLTRRPPSHCDIRRLAQHWMNEPDAAPLLLPRVVIALPRLMGALVPPAGAPDPREQVFRRRLMTACCLAEASRDGFSRFGLVEDAAWPKAAVRIAAAVAEEAGLRLCALFLRRPARRASSGPSDDA